LGTQVPRLWDRLTQVQQQSHRSVDP